MKIPNAFASLFLDIAQPSLFDNTIRGFFQDLTKTFHMRHKLLQFIKQTFTKLHVINI